MKTYTAIITEENNLQVKDGKKQLLSVEIPEKVSPDTVLESNGYARVTSWDTAGKYTRTLVNRIR